MHREIARVAASVGHASCVRCVLHKTFYALRRDVELLDNRVDTHQAGDVCEITTDGLEVCATRTDPVVDGIAPRVLCVYGNFSVPEGVPDAVVAVAGPPVSVFIDNSNENTKYATASVHCRRRAASERPY